MGFWKGVGDFFVNTAKGLDTIASNLPVYNIVYNSVKAGGAMVVAGAVAATGNDASDIVDFAGDQMQEIADHPLGDPIKALKATDEVAPNIPIVGTVYDTGKALGATAAAGVIAAAGGDPHPMLDEARDAGIDAGINAVTDVVSVVSIGALTATARAAGTVAKIGTKAALSGAARAAEEAALESTAATLKSAASTVGRTTAEKLAAKAAKAAAKAEMASSKVALAEVEHEAAQTAFLVAAEEMAEENAVREVTEAALSAEKAEAELLLKETELEVARTAEESAIKASEKAEAKALASAESAAAEAKLTLRQKLWKSAKPTRMDVLLATGARMNDESPDTSFPAPGVEDLKAPQLHPEVDFTSFLTQIRNEQTLKSYQHQNEISKYLAPDYSYLILPLLVTAGVLIVSESS